MTELLCDILEITTIGENEYFLVYSSIEDKSYTIPSHQLLKYNVDVGQRHFFKKEQNLKSKQFFLNYVKSELNILNKHYEGGKVYDFNIIEFENGVNKKGENIVIINVEDVDKNIIKVQALKWQKNEIWQHKTLSCEVERIQDNGIPKLINKDFRHPFYILDEEYEFEVIGEKIKETEKGRYDIFQLKGVDDCIHEVNMLPGQKLSNVKPERITCKVMGITYRLKLHQVNIKDPFFVTFDKIENNKELENKYFSSLFKIEDRANKDIVQLIEQFNSKSAFWVFTFTNKILFKQFRETVDRQDFKQAKEINNLIITFEEWIITKGIITSFPDEEVRNNTTLRAKNALESAKIRDEVLTKLCTNQCDILSDDSIFQNKKNLLEKLYHIINFTSINLLQDNLFIFRLKEIIKSASIESESELYYLDKLLKHISYNKNVFISDEEKEYFSLSTSNIGTDKFSEDEIKYLNWSYSEILIAQKLRMQEHVNILCGQLLKIFTKSYLDIKKKECLLFNAYRYFENYQSTELLLPFTFNDQLLINFDLLESNITNDSETNEKWDELENLFACNESFSVTLTKKSKTGYEVNFGNLRGFLPYHHIKDRKLKSYDFEESDFTISAKCLSISRPFNFFIIEQLSNADFSDSYKNNLLFKINNLYDAVITNIVGYGLFLSTSAGEGLLHINEIFDYKWNDSDLNKYFKKGQKIKVVLSDLTNDKKAQFSFLKVKDIEPLYYNNFIERVINKNTNDFFEIPKEVELDTNFEKTLNEKAFCIEQFAVLQLDINKKLQNFQIAKQFYTNANNARSFLINIYASYFEILLEIKETLESANLVNIKNIKAKAQDIKNKIDQKTIDKFPDSDKLIFFLKIISMFNEKEDSTLELLFDYVKKSHNETTQKDLRTVAKITLANNLMISESKEDSDYILKNLRLIYDYLSNGILSLEESIEDRNARELKEEILYWQERIKEDESETLEFKSSFYTPILDEDALKKISFIDNLEKKTEKNNIDISRINGDLARKRLIHSALKTLVAFANSNGGTLLIGVDNDKNIIGLEKEYQSLDPKLKFQNRDGFGLYFDDRVRNYIGDSFSSLMNRKFLKFTQGDILVVKVEPSVNEIFLLKNEEGKDCEQLYIRNLSSSIELTGSEFAKFIKNRHVGQLSKNISS